MQSVIVTLRELVYNAFNRTNEAFEMPAIIGATQSSKTVEYRLLENIAALNGLHGTKLQAMQETVLADILLAETTGWFTPDVSEHAQKLIAQLA